KVLPINCLRDRPRRRAAAILTSSIRPERSNVTYPIGANSKRPTYRWIASSSSVFGYRKLRLGIDFTVAGLFPFALPDPSVIGFIFFVAAIDSRAARRADAIILRR